MSEPKILKVAVCLFDGVTTLDYLGSMELFGFLAPEWRSSLNINSEYSFEIRYVGKSAEINPTSGPRVRVDLTIEEAAKLGQQFDIIFVPGGPVPVIKAVPEELIEFLKSQIPGAKYVLSACTGSWILARTGVLEGKRATTNKFAFKEVKAETSDKIKWVAKARWTVDGNIWTSSGVTAGMDMSNAFLEQLVGKDGTRHIRNVIEFTPKEEGEDEFAAVYGLV